MQDNQMQQFQNPGQMAPINPGSQSVTQSFSGMQTQQNAGTADSAIAAQVKAQVEARYIMAMRMPRDLDVVRVNILKDCRRPGFANTARYSKPVGRDKVEGWSIRFAESVLLRMRNLTAEQITIFDDESKRIIRVMVTDLEANTTYTQDLVIDKVVERNQLRPGQTAVRTRTNAQGRLTYTVQASESDLANKEAALVSKSIRNLTLRMLPGDIAEDALDVVRETIKRDIHDNPDAARRKIIDAFAAINIEPPQLAEYVGCELSQMAPKDIEELRTAYSGLKQGEVRWRDLLDSKKAHADEATGTDAKSKATAVRNKLKGRGKPEAEDVKAPGDSDAIVAALKAAGEKADQASDDDDDGYPNA